MCQLLNNEGPSVTRVGKSERISNIGCFCRRKLAPAGEDVFVFKRPSRIGLHNFIEELNTIFCIHNTDNRDSK